MKRVLENGADREASEVRAPRVSGPRAVPRRGGSYSRGHRTDDGERGSRDVHSVEMKADVQTVKSMAGAVIGRGGETVHGIRKKTGCQVHIRKGRRDEEENVVELKGTKAQIEAALEEVRAVFETVDPDYAQRHPGISGASVQLKTLPEMVGCLIGRKGDRVRSIQDTTGATVKVHKKPEGDDLQDVFIYGTLDQVADAQELVTEALLSYDPTRSRNRYTAAPRNTVVPGAVPSLGGAMPTAGVDGRVVMPGLGQPAMVAAAGQTPVVVQPAPGAITPPSTMLLLQPDGTLQPVNFVTQTVPALATPQALVTPQMVNPGAGALIAPAGAGVLPATTGVLPSGTGVLPTGVIQPQQLVSLDALSTTLGLGVGPDLGTQGVAFPGGGLGNVVGQPGSQISQAGRMGLNSPRF